MAGYRIGLIIAFAGLDWFHLQALAMAGAVHGQRALSVGANAPSVLVFLGIPLVAGYLALTVGE